MSATLPTSHAGPSPRHAARAVLVRRAIVLAVLVGVGFTLAAVALATGDVATTWADVLAALRGSDAPGATYVVAELRLPRVLGALLVGVGLGAAGAVTQSLLRNPLASPDIIGVTAGASTAAVLALAGGTALTTAQGWLTGMPVALAALTGGLVAGAIVLACAWQRGLTPHRVVLVGLGVNAGFGGLTSWVLLRADLSGLATSLTWLTGSLNQVRTASLVPVALGVVVLLVCLGLTGRTLGLLRYDARVAAALGTRVGAAQLVLLGLAIALASLVTAVAGPVPFIAFVAPQVALVLLRTEGPPVAGAAVVGAVMMLGADLVASRAFPEPLPVGVVTAFVGVPVLLLVLLRARSRA
ncbi:iron chelate uptake ABC transporter family permease subunit [Sanguibacter sp. HDW7]|uniref:FecCD family ABC transporter permease n=1 Tax=Sanguibacter sp. HDW7 TaxID=2714931 RepID=UPI00140751A9|nr:iron chelate uptake ABC transporter family permease subunit [Sanguibacter sp. HDW7]QIK82929.1 iron chelate uptake ABC transporter family permease subunit [Sanguibacter sp. HDW7]